MAIRIRYAAFTIDLQEPAEPSAAISYLRGRCELTSEPKSAAG
jgi:hypothetical protein